MAPWTLKTTGCDSPGRCAIRSGPDRRSIRTLDTYTGFDISVGVSFLTSNTVAIVYPLRPDWTVCQLAKAAEASQPNVCRVYDIGDSQWRALSYHGIPRRPPSFSTKSSVRWFGRS